MALPAINLSVWPVCECKCESVWHRNRCIATGARAWLPLAPYCRYIFYFNLFNKSQSRKGKFAALVSTSSSSRSLHLPHSIWHTFWPLFSSFRHWEQDGNSLQWPFWPGRNNMQTIFTVTWPKYTKCLRLAERQTDRRTYGHVRL